MAAASAPEPSPPRAGLSGLAALYAWWNSRRPLLKYGLVIAPLLAAVFAASFLCAAEDEPAAAPVAAAVPTPEPTPAPEPTPTATPVPTATPPPLGIVPLRQHHYQDYRYYHFLYEYERCLAHAAAVRQALAEAGAADAGEPAPTPPPLPDEYLLEIHTLGDLPSAAQALLAHYRQDLCPEIPDYYLLRGRTKWLLDWHSQAEGSGLTPLTPLLSPAP